MTAARCSVSWVLSVLTSYHPAQWGASCLGAEAEIIMGDRKVLVLLPPGEAAWLAFWLVVALGLVTTALPSQPELWQWGILTG